MKILITGASGFLGSIIARQFSYQEVITVGRFNGDILAHLEKEVPNLPTVDLVVHAAGKAHLVPRTAAERQEFFNVNVTGTQHLLNALELNSALPKAFLFISSVAVYGKEEGQFIKEDSLLLAKDPYGYSKIQAENLVERWCRLNNVICTIFRLPLIAGPKPPGNLSTMINGIRKGYYFNIEGGKARKSMVFAEDVAKIILKAVSIGGVYNLTDGHHPSFAELADVIARQLNRPVPFNIPLWIAMTIAKAGNLMGKNAPLNSSKLRKIISDLTFDDSKACTLLGWEPSSVLKNFKIT